MERARQKKSLQRGGDRNRVELDVVEPAISSLGCDDLLDLDQALTRLEAKTLEKLNW